MACTYDDHRTFKIVTDTLSQFRARHLKVGIKNQEYTIHSLIIKIFTTMSIKLFFITVYIHELFLFKFLSNQIKYV